MAKATPCLSSLDVYFILVNPKLPENVGAAARALKTMGFQKLRLAGEALNCHERAQWVAHGSADILQSAEVYANLVNAVKDIDFVIGTTASFRNSRKFYPSAQQLPTIIEKKRNTISSVAVVFGSEESGLSNSDIALCHILSRIPIASPYPSLNLAQSVMIYAYELSRFSLAVPNSSTPSKDKLLSQYKTLRKFVAELLDKLNIPAAYPLRVRIMERIGMMEEIDVHLALSVCKKLIKYVERSK